MGNSVELSCLLRQQFLLPTHRNNAAETKMSFNDSQKPNAEVESGDRVSPTSSTSASFRPKAGEWVLVKSLSSIADTLDRDGVLEGLPFMPEMAAHCGKRLRVKRFANKTCVYAESTYIGQLKDCVVLQIEERCDGSDHGGCEMGCQFFWKTEWLIPDRSNATEPEQPKSEQPGNDSIVDWLVEKTKTGQQPIQYRCQATELVQIAKPISPFKFRQYVDDHRRDKVALSAIGGFLFSLITKKLTRKSDNLAGPNLHRTPSERLRLKIGERVRVKTLADIQQTLDGNGCNRGLWFDPKEMAQFCGKELVVSRLITKLIDENSGKLRIMKQPTVVLSETECSGVFRRFCSRGSLHFWREIWLERTSGT